MWRRTHTALRVLNWDSTLPGPHGNLLELAMRSWILLFFWCGILAAGNGIVQGSGLATAPAASDDRWERTYQQRTNWWSLQPLKPSAPPPVRNPQWPRNAVDRYILAGLDAQNLSPAPEADRQTLARRLSFALTGLPPTPSWVETFVADTAPDAYKRLVKSLLDSPHFGERWARHWMDVVHYGDTHGYEWDVPAKNAWRFRDYLIRAFNADVPIQQLLLEHIAGDLVEPRVDPEQGINEALIGPMSLRLGERRHGDNAAAEGVTQEAMSNIIDTVGRGFLGTTLACAQCHDHKLDAVAQRDYYALTGVLMSTRWVSRCLDTQDPNPEILEELRGLKEDVRRELARVWQAERDRVRERIENLPAINTNKTATAFPETLLGFWQRAHREPILAVHFQQERARRQASNQVNLQLVADFTQENPSGGWRFEGFGMKHGLSRDGEIVVADEGDVFLPQLLPAGRWSHRWSMRLAGALRSPILEPQNPPRYLSLGIAAGRRAAYAMIVDHAINSERMAFLERPAPDWLRLKVGEYDTLEGSLDQGRRRVFLEVVTKSLNNYFPPRTGYGGISEQEVASELSWFGVTRVYQHPTNQPPLDELGRFAPLFDGSMADLPDYDWAGRLARRIHDAVDQWTRGEADSECVRLLNDALGANLLPNYGGADPKLGAAVERYRNVQRRLRADQTVGSVEEWAEGRDERLARRGSYLEFDQEVPRGAGRLLSHFAPTACATRSGRLEFAHSVVDPQNPLTARVFVNRVWHHLFGEGLVRTPDDFGHLGQRPTHPELLDHLADEFMRDGWSMKRLIARLVTSATWRQTDQTSELAQTLDPENRLWHHRPMRRLEAEAIRDALLAVSGRWDPDLYGPAIPPYRTAEDAAKRLFSGPLDGNGRRSLYLAMTLMEPPRFLALFNQPIPKLTTGHRDVTSVPDQALALLNDPFVSAMAQYWSTHVLKDGAVSLEPRVRRMFTTALGRPPTPEETARLVTLVRRMGGLRGSDEHLLLACQPAWQDVAHALINLNEFIYVR